MPVNIPALLWEESAFVRKNFVIGTLLAVAAGLAVLVGSALELELESVALLGAALGAVLALVPDRTPLVRLGGFAAGFVVAWIGYVVRAALLPDTSAGRAVAVFVVILLCAVIAAATADRLPLWTLLLGTAALTGAYELTYAAAPPELMSTSVSTATTLLLSLSVGFCTVAILGLSASTARRDDERPALAASDTKGDFERDHTHDHALEQDLDQDLEHDLMEISK